MNRIFLKRSLKTRITFFTLTIFLLSIWSLAYYTHRKLHQDMEIVLGEQQISTVSAIAADLNSEVEDRIKALEAVCARITPAMVADNAALQKFLEDRTTLITLFNSGLWFTGVDGVGIADVPISTKRIGVDYSERAFMIGALQGKTTIGKPVMGKQLKAPAFAIASPVKDSDGKVIGVLLGAINLGKPNFLDRVTDRRHGKTGDFLLVSRSERTIVAITDKARVMEKLPEKGKIALLDQFIEGREGSGVTIDARGINVLASAKNVPATDWYVAALLPTDEGFAPVHDMQKHIVIATLFLTLLAGCLTWWLLKRQLAPLMEAAEALAAMSDASKPLQSLAVASNDEIGDLIDGFNRLLNALKQREDTLHEQTVQLEFEIAERQKAHEGLQNKTLELEHEIEERQAAQQSLEEQTSMLEEEISERTRIQEEHGRLEEQLLQSQKMEAIGLLAGGVAHDFNNILSVIMGYGDLLTVKQSDEKVREYTLQILSASERAAELTRGLLAFSRKQAFNLERTNLIQLATDNTKFLKRLIGEDIELVTMYPLNPLYVFIDRSQFQQVLMNLATNARDAMPDGGKLTICIAESQDANLVVKDGCGSTGKFVLISVSDTGVGMDKETVERIFDPFYTTKDKEKGTGLGLSIIHGIISQHNGSIHCSSEPGKGTTFSIYIPICEEPEEEACTKTETERHSLKGTETILLADDDKILIDITAHHLESNGYRVLKAINGADAVDVFTRNKDEINLVILDAIMPKLTGKQALEAIRILRPEVKACFISGYTSEIISGKIAIDFDVPLIKKPVMPVILLRKVREILDLPPST
jgi:signal transduction histidine kinase